MTQPSLVAAYVLVGTIVVVSRASGPITAHAQSATDFVPVTDAMLQDPAPADWLMWQGEAGGSGGSLEERPTRDGTAVLSLSYAPVHSRDISSVNCRGLNAFEAHPPPIGRPTIALRRNVSVDVEHVQVPHASGPGDPAALGYRLG